MSRPGPGVIHLAVERAPSAPHSTSNTASRTARGDWPRERLRRLGSSSLSDAELVALLLRTGCGGRDALEVARDLLARCGGLRGLVGAVEPEFAAVRGLGPAKIASLEAAIEIGRRLTHERVPKRVAIADPRDVHRHFYSRLRDRRQETFFALLLDSRHRIMKEVVVSQGTLTASLVHPREVFRAAVREAAAAIVLVHNHPSGDPHPSTEDRAVTERLMRAGTLMGIRIIDHVIVAEQGYFSFSESGNLPDAPRGEDFVKNT